MSPSAVSPEARSSSRATSRRRFFDNRFVDDYNRFDHEEVVRQARAFRN